jgi:hypothetical protein
MTDIWFVFENNGQFLFKTKQSETLSLIPGNYTLPIIIKNPPGYNPNITQVASYDKINNKVIFTEATTLDNIGSSVLPKSIQIVNYKELKDDIATNKFNINNNVQTINTHINNTAGDAVDDAGDAGEDLGDAGEDLGDTIGDSLGNAGQDVIDTVIPFV